MYTFIYIIVFTTYNLYSPPQSSVGFASVVPPGRARDAWPPGRCGVHSRSDHGIDGIVANVRPRSEKKRMNF